MIRTKVNVSYVDHEVKKNLDIMNNFNKFTNHNNYNFLDCDWFKNSCFPLIHLFVNGQLVIGQFDISQSHSKL